MLIHSVLLSCLCDCSQVLGFGEYIEEVYAAYEQHKLETMVIIDFYMFPVTFSLGKSDVF